MSVNNVNQQASLQPALDCLFNSDIDFDDPGDHYIGHNHLSTVEIWSYTEEEWPDFIYKDILPENLQAWVDQEAPTRKGKKPLASLKMMVGTKNNTWSRHESGEWDELRKSMLHLSSRFSLPPSYLANDTMLLERFLSYEGFPEPYNIGSYQAGFEDLGIAWSFDPKTNASRAVLTIRRDDRGKLIEYLKKSSILLDHVLFLPYVMTVFSVTSFSLWVFHCERDGRKLDHDIQNYLQHQDDPNAYAAWIFKFDGNAYGLTTVTKGMGVLKNVRQLVKHFLSREESPSIDFSSAARSFSAKKADFLKACLRNLDQRAAATISKLQDVKSDLHHKSLL